MHDSSSVLLCTVPVLLQLRRIVFNSFCCGFCRLQRILAPGVTTGISGGTNDAKGFCFRAIWVLSLCGIGNKKGVLVNARLGPSSMAAGG